MKKRKWPTVPEILREAVCIWRGVLIVYYLDRQGEIRHVHAATAPNLLKTIDGSWTRTVELDRISYTPPPQTGAATAPGVS